MGLISTLISRITVFLMISLLTECYPRMYPRTFQQGGEYLENQQLLNSQFQAENLQSAPMHDPVPQPRQKTVSVNCYEEAMEIVMNADLFASGFPVEADELWLGQKSSLSEASCGAMKTGESQFSIIAFFKDCGTTLSVTGDSLVYSNVLVYAPLPSPEGLLRQDGAVIPVHCQFQRRFNVDSAAVVPAWIPFASTISTTDYLDFSLQLMSDDWQYERGSNIYFLGDKINLHASVTLANHLPLHLFIDWCVATPTFNFEDDEIQYSFVDHHGCLVDSRISYSHSKFLQRSDSNKLNLVLDAFRFHKLTTNLVYITCYLKAIPAAYPVSTQNRACSFYDGRWQSVDGSDEVCNSCEPSTQDAAKPKPIQPLHVTLAPPALAPPVKQPNYDFMQSPQYAYGSHSKRGTDSKEDWKIATLGPLFLAPEQGTTTQSTTRHPQFGPAEDFSTLAPEDSSISVTEDASTFSSNTEAVSTSSTSATEDSSISSTSLTEEDSTSATEHSSILASEKPKFFFSSIEMSNVTDEPKFETTPETRSFSLLEGGLFPNASDLFRSEEGSRFEESL